MSITVTTFLELENDGVKTKYEFGYFLKVSPF